MALPAPLPGPSLTDYLQQMPPELRRALVDYVQAEYLADVGQAELAEQKRGRFFGAISDYDHEPRSQTTSQLSPTY
jgi:hypothetical protein